MKVKNAKFSFLLGVGLGCAFGDIIRDLLTKTGILTEEMERDLEIILEHPLVGLLLADFANNLVTESILKTIKERDPVLYELIQKGLKSKCPTSHSSELLSVSPSGISLQTSTGQASSSDSSAGETSSSSRSDSTEPLDTK